MLPQRLSVIRTIAVHKILSRHPLLSLYLNLDQFERGVLCAAGQRQVSLHLYSRDRHLGRNRTGEPDMKVLAAKAGEGSGPGLKAAQTVPDFRRRSGEVNLPIFFFED